MNSVPIRPPRPNKRITIAFGVNMEIGGTELNAVRTAERLDTERFRVIAVFGDDGPLSERYRAAGIPIHGFPIRNLYGPGAVGQGLRLMRLLREEKTDVFHSHDVYNNIFGTLYAHLARVPVTIASRRWWHTVPRPALNRINRWFSRRATCVLANSPSVAKMVAAEEGVPSSRIAVVPNFLDESAFSPLDPEERSRILAGIGVPAGVPVVGCVANLNPVKNHPLLLRAASRLRSRHPSVHYVLLGEGPCRAELESLVGELGLQRQVHLPGQWMRPWNLHGLFDVSVLCSTSEGFPNSIVEAMAAAKPILATRVGGTVDAITDDETGLLMPSGDEWGFSEALDRLLSDSDLRERLGSAARTRALADYGVDGVIPRLETLYECLLEGGGCESILGVRRAEVRDGPGICAE